MQGRFTSPDEFKGGPDELYDFEEDASANPTFYADLTNPQSLNKYQYTYNNPYKYTDPTGHNPCCMTMPLPIEVVLPRVGPIPAGTFTYPLVGPVPNIAMWDEAGNGLDRAGNIVRPAPSKAAIPSRGIADLRRADDTNVGSTNGTTLVSVDNGSGGGSSLDALNAAARAVVSSAIRGETPAQTANAAKQTFNANRVPGSDDDGDKVNSRVLRPVN